MKRLAIVLLMLIILVNSGFAEVQRVTYEQIRDGECNGKTVTVMAIAKPIVRFYNLIAIWAVETEDGSYEQLTTSDSTWCLTEQDYNESSASVKKLIDAREPLELTVYVHSPERVRIDKIRVASATSNDSAPVPIEVLEAILIVLIITVCTALWVSDKRSKARAQANGGIDPHIVEAQRKAEAIRQADREKREERELARTVIKTQILDSRSTTTSKGSVTSSASRAIVGNFIAGPIGAMIGASTGKRTYHEHKETTFKVWYGDGSIKLKTVSNGSYAWQKYMEKIEE